MPKNAKESEPKECLSVIVVGNPWIVYPEPQYKVAQDVAYIALTEITPIRVLTFDIQRVGQRQTI